MKISALFFILIASIATAQTSGDVIGKIDLYEFIRTADELTLYSVDPTWPDSTPPEAQTAKIEKFNGHVVFGKVRGEKVREKIRAALTAALTYFPDGSCECFEPRIGIRLMAGDRQLDILLCYRCRQSCFYYDGVKQYADLGPRGEAEFNALLDEQKIKRNISGN